MHCVCLHSSKALTGNDFRSVYNVLYKARSKWRALGIQLEMDVSDLDDIEEHRGNERRLEAMIRKWLKGH